MCRGHTGTPYCEVFQDKWRTCWHLQSLVHELEATAKNGVFPSIFHRFRLILLVWQVRFSLRTKKKEKILKIARKIICLEYLHGLPYTHWRCCILNGMHMSTTVCFSIDFHIRLKFHILAFECFWIFHAVFDIQAPKNVDKWKPLDYQTVWKRFRHYISKILDSIPQGNKVKCFFFIYYDLLQQNVRSHLLTTGYFLFNNPLTFKALLHACGTS